MGSQDEPNKQPRPLKYEAGSAPKQPSLTLLGEPETASTSPPYAASSPPPPSGASSASANKQGQPNGVNATTSKSTAPASKSSVTTTATTTPTITSGGPAANTNATANPPQQPQTAATNAASSLVRTSVSQELPPQAATAATELSARQHNYLVASHSLRVTKFGYTIDPVELRYAEVTSKLSTSQRRRSDASLDASQLGHKILTLIRGYWSQPAWPRGRQMTERQQQQQERHLQQLYQVSPIEALVSFFKSAPFYPHKKTLGQMCKDRALSAASPPQLASDPRDRPVRTTSPSVKLFHKRPASKQQPVSMPGSSTPTASGGSSATSSPSIASVHLSASDSYLPTLSPTNSTPSSESASPPHPSQQKQKSRSKRAGQTASTSSTSRARSLFDPNVFYLSWVPRNVDLIAELVGELCQQLERVFANEPRILSISSPCLVLGDIHGNLSDLRTYERSLWPKAPSCLTSNYLFLGDYVDRGDYSVECVLYLFAMKLMAPDRFFLLRGNHEIAAIQRQYTFGSECEAKFGVAGHQLWRLFNRVFNVMPIAATIDQEIFCAHGGIPRSTTDISLLANDIPTPLDNPEFQSPAAWEILWNDPITDSELVAMIEIDSVALSTSHPSANDVGPRADSSGPRAAATSETSGSPQTGASKTVPPGRGQGQGQQQQRPTSESALSFYIRAAPEANQAQQAQQGHAQNRPPAQVQKKTQAGAARELVEQERKTASQASGTLRSVPSDTSSVASTSPQQLLNDGFVSNVKRGTAFLFSDKAIDHFLAVNRLSYVIRAHEVIPTGFALHGDGRVLTIFSSSQYCGLNNQAACALVERDRIRILRLDTGDSGE